MGLRAERVGGSAGKLMERCSDGSYENAVVSAIMMSLAVPKLPTLIWVGNELDTKSRQGRCPELHRHADRPDNSTRGCDTSHGD